MTTLIKHLTTVTVATAERRRETGGSREEDMGDVHLSCALKRKCVIPPTTTEVIAMETCDCLSRPCFSLYCKLITLSASEMCQTLSKVSCSSLSSKQPQKTHMCLPERFTNKSQTRKKIEMVFLNEKFFTDSWLCS